MSFTPFNLAAADLSFLRNGWQDARDVTLAPWDMRYGANVDLGLSVNACFNDREMQQTDLTTPAPLIAAPDAMHRITQIANPLIAPTGFQKYNRDEGLFVAAEPGQPPPVPESCPSTLFAPCAICETLPKNESDAK